MITDITSESTDTACLTFEAESNDMGNQLFA